MDTIEIDDAPNVVESDAELGLSYGMHVLVSLACWTEVGHVDADEIDDAPEVIGSVAKLALPYVMHVLVSVV